MFRCSALSECTDTPIKEMMIDYIMGSSYAEIDLDESPCIIPSCGLATVWPYRAGNRHDGKRLGVRNQMVATAFFFFLSEVGG